LRNCAFDLRILRIDRCGMSSRRPVPRSTDPEYERWLDGIVRLTEGAELRGVHPDTIKRDAVRKGQLLQLGRRAVGVRRRFALMLD
jgi:hypothetical protein